MNISSDDCLTHAWQPEDWSCDVIQQKTTLTFIRWKEKNMGVCGCTQLRVAKKCCTYTSFKNFGREIFFSEVTGYSFSECLIFLSGFAHILQKMFHWNICLYNLILCKFLSIKGKSRWKNETLWQRTNFKLEKIPKHFNFTNPTFGQIFQMRFKNQHWFIDFWKIHYFEMGQYFQCAEYITIHLCPIFLPRPDTVEQISGKRAALRQWGYPLSISSLYKPSILQTDWKPKIQLVKLGIKKSFALNKMVLKVTQSIVFMFAVSRF